jgi:flagellar biosynthesis/type III secretory pathway protein FliH
MNKPDWADRLQRTFKKKYQQGFDEGYSKGYGEGFADGSRKAINESRKVFVKRIQKELTSLPENGKLEYRKGLQAAIELINRRK